jgi:hypothetical protein
VDTLLRHDDVIIDARGLIDIEAAVSAHTKTSRHLQVREKLNLESKGHVVPIVRHICCKHCGRSKTSQPPPVSACSQCHQTCSP